ncbi:MAG: glucose 1-dehydrogenase [Deltaproteobacteria bacterium]|nr:glucose 1-dehydrogenase [Deltaproteobacteria bacterium]
MGALDGKVTVITGGASGIGAATTRLFVKEGSRVVVADILDDNGQKMARDLGESVVYVHTDVTNENDIQAAIATAVEHFGRLDCLFNNAGVGGVDSAIGETDTVKLDATISLLFRAVVLGMKHAAPIMKAQGSGNIINTGSVAGLRTGFGPHVYSAMKAAVIHLTHSVAMELGESGVRVNAICPGGIVTPIFGRSLGLLPIQAEERLPVLHEIFAQMQPIKRAGQPEDIAAAALWLASDASSFVNGHALVVDGGVTGGMGWSQAQMMFDNMRSILGVES